MNLKAFRHSHENCNDYEKLEHSSKFMIHFYSKHDI